MSDIERSFAFNYDEKSCQFDIGFGSAKQETGNVYEGLQVVPELLNEYNGAYSVKPTRETQVLPVREKKMRYDLAVQGVTIREYSAGGDSYIVIGE